MPTNRGCGTRGTCGSCKAKKRKNGPARVALDKLHRLAGENVGRVFILPQGCLAAAHVTDAGDPVDDAHVVAVARVHLEQLGIGFAGGDALDRLTIAHRDRVGRVETHDAMAADVDAGYRDRRSLP